MKIMNSWKEILDDISRNIADIMENNVRQAVTEKLLENIKLEFYDNPPEPIKQGWVSHKTYVRRKALLSEDSIYWEIGTDSSGAITLFVTSDAPAGKSVRINAATGELYEWEVGPGEHGNFLYMMSKNNEISDDKLNLGFLNRTDAYRGVRYPVELTQDEVYEELSTGTGMVGRAFMNGMKQRF